MKWAEFWATVKDFMRRKKKSPNKVHTEPIEILLVKEFHGDVVECGKWFVRNYRNCTISDMMMIQILLIEEMTKVLDRE
jgi:hypothetical protein